MSSEPGDVSANGAGTAKSPSAAAPTADSVGTDKTPPSAAPSAVTTGAHEKRKRKRRSSIPFKHRKGHRTKRQGSAVEAKSAALHPAVEPVDGTPVGVTPVDATPVDVTPASAAEDESLGTTPRAPIKERRGASRADSRASDAEVTPTLLPENTSTTDISRTSRVSAQTLSQNEQEVFAHPLTKTSLEDMRSASPTAPALPHGTDRVSSENTPWPPGPSSPTPNESETLTVWPPPAQPTVHIPAASRPTAASGALGAVNAKAATRSRPTGILKATTADRRASGEDVVPDMIVVPLTSWAGTPDVTADRKCAIPPVPVSAYAESSDFVDSSRTPQQDTSLVRHRGKKTHFGAPSLKMVSPLAMTSPRKGLILKGAVIFILLTCIGGAVLIYFLWLYCSNPAVDRGFCDSTDCHHYEAFIGALLNRSIDPCDDFSAFVCSAWKSPSLYHRKSRSSREDVVDAWSKNFEVMLRRGRKYFEVGEKPLSMLSLCKYSSSYDATSSVESLQRFMEERKIRWPGQPLQDVDPLGVLLDLDFNWGMALWIRVEFLRKQGASGQRALRVSSAGRIREWLSLCRRLVSAGSFFDYWRKHYMLLATYGAPAPTQQQGNKTAEVQMAVLQQLLDASSNNTAIQFLLKDMKSHTSRIPSEQWIAMLNENIKVYPVFTGDDRIIASQPVLLTALNQIISSYHHDEIMENISWLFVQMIAPAVDASIWSLFPREGPTKPDDDAAVTAALQFAFCSSEVESAYRLLVISLHTAPNFPFKVRQEIDMRLRDIRKAAVDKIDAVEWLMPQSKRRAQGKLNASRILLWPSEQLLSSTALSIMYQTFPASDVNFIALWLRVRRSVQTLAWQYEGAMHMPANLVLPLVDYDYLLNSVRVSTQTLSPPVYYEQGTHAMFYGGLGFLYASQLVRALDAEGLRIDAEGDVVGELWLSPLWRHAVMDVAACLSGGGSYFPEIPALEITYRALETALARDGGRRLRIGFSERQLFFITLCFLTCARPGTQPPADCNKAVMNFPPFASEFGCRNSSKMKPVRQCPFFSQQI
ncbi:hypothetical protein MTO96_003718 [Rhipicephalus appendiculatus]